MLKQNVAKGRNKPIVDVFKICVKLWRCGEETNVAQAYRRQGGLGAESPAIGGYGDFLKIFVIFWK